MERYEYADLIFANVEPEPASRRQGVNQFGLVPIYFVCTPDDVASVFEGRGRLSVFNELGNSGWVINTFGESFKTVWWPESVLSIMGGMHYLRPREPVYTNYHMRRRLE